MALIIVRCFADPPGSTIDGMQRGTEFAGTYQLILPPFPIDSSHVQWRAPVRLSGEDEWIIVRGTT